MITGASPAAARGALRETLQLALSCVTPAVLVDRADSVESNFRLAGRVASARGFGHVQISVRHFYGLVSDAARDTSRSWQALTTGYAYRLEDAEGREILAWHWHQTGPSLEAQPHLHLGSGSGSLRPELQKAHVRTGFVTPVALLTLLIESFAVRPRRAVWAAILDAADQALAQT